MRAPNDKDAEIDELRRRLAAAEETLNAFRSGEIEGLGVDDVERAKAFAVADADRLDRAIVEQMREGAIALGPDGVVLYCNRRFAEMVGGTTAELIGSRFLDHLAAGQAPPFNDLIADSRGNSREFQLRRCDGERVPVSVAVSPLRTEASGCRIIVVADLGELKRMERAVAESEALRESEDRLRVANERLQLAISAGAVGTWDLDVATNVMTVGAKMREIYGLAPDTIVTLETVFSTLLPEDLPATRAALSAALKPSGDGRYRIEYRIRRANDGEERWIAANAQAFFEHGQVRLIGICRDVTDEKSTERLLVEKARLAEQLASVAAAVPGAIYSFRMSADGRQSVPYASANWRDVCGLAPEEVQTDARAAIERIHADDADRVRASIAKSARALTPWRGEFRYRHPEKGLIWLEAQSTPAQEPSGDMVWHGHVQDVTERKRSEAALTASEARLRATIDGAKDAIVTVEESGIVQSFNRAAAATFGYEADEVVGRNVSMLMPEPYCSRHDAYIRNYLRTGEAKIIGIGREVEGRRKDGTIFPMELTVSEARYDSCHLFVGFARDLSERRKIEARIEKLHADRLNAMGGMATALAHEINQPLSATATYLKAARQLLAKPPELRPASVEETLDNAAAQVVRAGRIVAHMREFVARGEPDKTLENLHDLIEEAHELTIAGARQADVRVTLRLNAESDRILADKVQIKQALVNLIRNAIEAMNASDTRELTVSTRGVEKNMIRIDIADTGSGLSDEVKPYLFEPFATTKTKGIGVGLSLSRWIIEAHYGKIWFEPNPGGGAVFSFTLPAADAEIEP